MPDQVKREYIIMSEEEIRNQCPELQAKAILRLQSHGWEIVELEKNGEAELRNGGVVCWVKTDGSSYP